GSSGFHPRSADILMRGLSEENAYTAVQTALEYYNENGQMGEKLGNFIDRISIDIFKRDILKLLEEKGVNENDN
ncbi:MAG: hypothetical protein ACRC6B_05640, partial [Fusobacteriaceae bacterium]